MRSTILLLSALLFHGILFGQTQFKPGFIITEPGDTLFGELDYRSDYIMCKECVFRTHQNAEKEVYKPGDIYGFQFTNSRHFISKETAYGTYFLEFLVDGVMDVYYLRTDEKDYYFIEKDGKPLKELEFEKGSRMRDGHENFYSSTKHMGILKYYMSDATGFDKKIEGITEPMHRNLIKLAEDYHYEVCEDGEPCITYKNPIPFARFSVELVWSITKLKHPALNDDISGDNNYFTNAGFNIYSQLFRTNERLFFKTGFYNPVLIGFPLQYQYRYPSKIIQPKITFGNTIYPQFNSRTFDFGIGANIRLYNKISLSADFETSLTPIIDIFFGDDYPIILWGIVHVGLHFDL